MALRKFLKEVCVSFSKFFVNYANLHIFLQKNKGVALLRQPLNMIFTGVYCSVILLVYKESPALMLYK